MAVNVTAAQRAAFEFRFAKPSGDFFEPPSRLPRTCARNRKYIHKRIKYTIHIGTRTLTNSAVFVEVRVWKQSERNVRRKLFTGVVPRRNIAKFHALLIRESRDTMRIDKNRFRRTPGRKRSATARRQNRSKSPRKKSHTKNPKKRQASKIETWRSAWLCMRAIVVYHFEFTFRYRFSNYCLDKT